MKKLIEVSRLKFAETTIRLEGNPFSLEFYPMFKPMYNKEFSNLLLKCSRQVGKTVTQHNLGLIESVAIPGFRTLYVSPSQEQTKRFSVSKLGKVLQNSPDIKSLLLGPGHIKNVMHHLYSNDSEFFFSYAGDDADRIRGISADRINYDEIQDIPYDGVVPVINEVSGRSPYDWKTYAGTPKSKDNPIEFLWQNSTQNEWAIKCEACGHYNIYVSMKGLGKKGLSCQKCGRYVDVNKGTWISMNEGSDVEGYHISQIFLPESNPKSARSEEEFHLRLKKWKAILRKLESGEYSQTEFLNEVIGVSTSAGTRLLSRGMLESMCEETRDMLATTSWNPSMYECIVAGIDWGGNGKDGYSKTALTIMGTRYDGNYDIIFHKIYPLENPVDTLQDIMKHLHHYRVSCVGADAGGGSLPNASLRKEFGYQRCYPILYGSQKKMVVWDEEMQQGLFKTDKTQVIDDYVLELRKRTTIRFPNKKDCGDVFTHMLNVFEEARPGGKKVWIKHPKSIDDAFHSQVFAWVATQIFRGKWSTNMQAEDAGGEVLYSY